METNKKLLRITTVPISLKTLLKGQLRYMSQHYNVIGISSGGQELEDVGRDEGIQVVSVEMTRQMTPFRDLISLWKMIVILRKEKPEIVHTHTPKAGIIGMLAAKLAGVPIRLHTVAGLPLMEATGIKRKVLDLVEKLTYAFSTKVYPNSKGLYDFILQNKFVSKEKLKVIANGSTNGINTEVFCSSQVTDEDRGSLRRKLNIGLQDFVFVFVGRLVSDKGINELVKAFGQICESSTLLGSPKLLLVGPLESELDPLLPWSLQEIKENKNIISIGFQKDVRPYFAISNALIFPSYREGFPNVVMQAGAMGLPSIVSNINGCNEIIVEGRNGTIIPVKNVEAIESTMLKMINDKPYYASLQTHAREMIQDRYEQEVVWSALLEEYNSLLKEKGIR